VYNAEIALKNVIYLTPADTPEIAKALLQQALHLSFAQSLRVIISQSNQAAQLLLKQAGFLPERCWQSMRLGRIADLGGRQWLYGYANLYVGRLTHQSSQLPALKATLFFFTPPHGKSQTFI
jgi:hypothetical protein